MLVKRRLRNKAAPKGHVRNEVTRVSEANGGGRIKMQRRRRGERGICPPLCPRVRAPICVPFGVPFRVWAFKWKEIEEKRKKKKKKRK